MIPSLGIETYIEGVPLTTEGWNVSWLGAHVGFLEGSAFPTLYGNTVLTGHVWDANNRPGVFAKLNSLNYGDQIMIQTWGKTYIYEVRESKRVNANNVPIALQHEELDWITLVTCEGFNPFNGNYLFRRMVRAVLVEVR